MDDRWAGLGSMQQNTKILPQNFEDDLSKYVIISWVYSSLYSLRKNLNELAVITHFIVSYVARGIIMQMYL